MKFLYDDSLTKEHDIKQIGEQLVPYIERCEKIAMANSYDAPESSLHLPFDNSIAEKVFAAVKEKASAQLKYIVLIGIGGSNLGAKAAYDALFGYADAINPDRFPKMLFMESCDSNYALRIQTFLQEQVKNPRELLIVIASKSGSTMETAANAEFLLQTLSNNIKDILERTLVVTDKDSPLWKSAGERGIALLEVPKIVGGRYSIFSSIGLFPLAASRIDIAAFLEGARRSLKQGFERNIVSNPAALSAAVQFFYFKKGIGLHNLFLFCPELESVGEWARQLAGESLGKEQDNEGNTVNAGITPIVSIGTADLHSMLQLYLAGPRDKLTTFVSQETQNNEAAIPNAEPIIFQDAVQNIKGKSFTELTRAILEGVKRSYRAKQLPFLEIVLEDADERSLGELLQHTMMETMFLANLLQINAFDQPAVEEYKKETKKLLH